MEKIIRKELMEEIYFKYPGQELEYFEKRLDAIEKYDVPFFMDYAKARLAERYIRALALLSLQDTMEVKAYVDLYVECLSRLGVSDYCVDQEVENYKNTHSLVSTTKDDMFVSHSGRKGMK